MSIATLRLFLSSSLASGSALSFSSLVWQPGSEDKAEALKAFPNRQTAYKVSRIGMKTCYCWSMLNILPDAASFIYSKLTGNTLALPSFTGNILSLPSWCVKTLKVSNALCLGTAFVMLIPALYARSWQVTDATKETQRQRDYAREDQDLNLEE